MSSWDAAAVISEQSLGKRPRPAVGHNNEVQQQPQASIHHHRSPEESSSNINSNTNDNNNERQSQHHQRLSDLRRLEARRREGEALKRLLDGEPFSKIAKQRNFWMHGAVEQQEEEVAELRGILCSTEKNKPFARRLSDYTSPGGSNVYRPRPEWYTPHRPWFQRIKDGGDDANSSKISSDLSGDDNNDQDDNPTLGLGVVGSGSTEEGDAESVAVGVPTGGDEEPENNHEEEQAQQAAPSNGLLPDDLFEDFLPQRQSQVEEQQPPAMRGEVLVDNEPVPPQQNEGDDDGADDDSFESGVSNPFFAAAVAEGHEFQHVVPPAAGVGGGGGSVSSSRELNRPRVSPRIQVFGRDSDTALHVAIRSGATDAALGLLQAGFRVDMENGKGVTPLILGAQKGNYKVVRTLLKLGANPNAVSASGSTAVLQAAHFGHRNILQLLLSRGGWRLMEVANLNQTTPLMRAAQEGHFDICSDLLRAGASVNRLNRVQMSALMLASQRGHPKICQLLIDYGADMDACTTQESTSLMLACKRAQVEVVKVMVTAGCELYRKDTRGRTARDIATRKPDHVKTQLLHYLDSQVQAHLMQQASRRVRSFLLVKFYKLLQEGRAMVPMSGRSGGMNIHDLQPILNNPESRLPHYLKLFSVQALIRTMALPPNVFEHICGFIPLPNLWPRRMSMLTRRATIHPDAAVSTALDLVDEILEEGGFLEACDDANVVAPTHYSTWKEWKRCGRQRGPICHSSELPQPNSNNTGLVGTERLVVTAALPAEEPDAPQPSLIQMRRSAGYMSILAHRTTHLTTVLQNPPYNLSPTTLMQLKHSADLASLVRRMGSNGGVHFDSNVAMDLVMLISRLCAWYWRESEPPLFVQKPPPVHVSSLGNRFREPRSFDV